MERKVKFTREDLISLLGVINDSNEAFIEELEDPFLEPLADALRQLLEDLDANEPSLVVIGVSHD